MDPQSVVDCDLIDRRVRKLRLGKACGPDDLTAEHIMYAHPSLITILCKLFKLIMTHRYVPCAFGVGTIVPLVEYKSRNLN